MTSNGHSNGSSVYTVPLQINGEEVKTEKTFDVVDPATGKVLWKGASASKEDAIKTVEAAQAAFPAWSRMKPSKRRDIFVNAANILRSRAEELGRYMIEETAADQSYALGFNVPNSVEMLKDIAGRIVTIVAQVPVLAEEGKSAIVYKEPYGVVLGIAPWNAPYILGFRAVAYALAGGNTTVLKGPELSPRCFWAIGSVFKEAGLPDGCLNILTYGPQDAAAITTALIEHPAVKKINYTGSTAVGSMVAATAGKNLKPVLMELGGKASAIVLADADLATAARACALGAFTYGGQVCMSTERILVHDSIVSPFRDHLKTAISQTYAPPNPAPILVTSIGVTKNKTLLSDATAKGAHLLTGDPAAPESSATRMRPVVVEGLTKDMDLYYTESFGPTVSLFAFAHEDQAVDLANDTEYGLSAAVFTESLTAGLRIARRIESGAVHINGMTVHDEPGLPHGGVKRSGWGRFGAGYGLEEFLKCKTVTWRD